jgi:glucose-1-phosphatase
MFDLGGVLIKCADFNKMLEWQNWSTDLSEIRRRWYASDTIINYQRGAISTKEFAETVISEFELTVNISRFFREFRLLPTGFYPGADVVLKQLSRNYVTACLSNTNELHWNKLCSVNKLEKYFKYCYPSHLINKVKPEKGAYTYALTALGVTSGEVAFFDDNKENVDAAKEAGIDAFLTDGFEELCEKLKELEII